LFFISASVGSVTAATEGGTNGATTLLVSGYAHVFVLL